MTGAFPLLPERASNLAPGVDALFYALTVMTAVLTLGIAGTILYFAVKYRRRDDDDMGAAVPARPSLEIIWSAIPLVICLGIFVWSAALYVRMSRPPEDAMVVQVIGKQWMWKLQHPNGRKEINELHVPLGRPVKLVMTSQDVIHSFYVPAFRIKQDVLPGRYSEQWFIPTKLGEYHLFCAEYCGTSHALMGGRVVVMSPGDYAAWAANAALDDRPEAAGARLFTQYGCAACHGQQAPTLAGIYNREQPLADGSRILADDNYLRESILAPRARIVAGYPPIMPSYDGQLSEEQFFQLLAYLISLAPATQPAATRPSLPGGAP
jgi:cytochrome c oxidase subunit 2